ncbi:MAG: hypothetical protein L3J52_00095 [Proteobacteria bacterium]|nr:hypothetical protein [Pseudomonadota bacterium]
MIDQTFKIVFRGKTIKGHDLAEAKLSFAKLFKLSPAKVESMFSGGNRVLKKSVSLEKANHFRTVLKRAGIKVSLIKNESEETSADKEKQWHVDEPGTVILKPVTAVDVHIETAHIKLSENLDIPLVEKANIEPPEVDISSIKFDDSEEPITKPKEVILPEFDLSAFNVDEPGIILVNSVRVKSPEIPIDGIELDEVGAKLVQKEYIPEPEIDIASISLEVER